MRLLIAFILTSFAVQSQIGMGQWRLHVPSKTAIDIVATNERVFTAFETGISDYEFSSNELSVWDAVNGLSDISISCLGNCSSNNSIFIGYENGNIDQIKNNRLTNIPAIKLADIQGSKRIHNLVEYQGHVYAATGFAIVKLDPVKNEVRDTYYPTNGNQAILDVAFLNDSIYALTEDKMYRGLASNIALADPSQWVLDTRVPLLSSNAYAELEEANDSLYILREGDNYGEDTIFVMRNQGMSSFLNESITMEVYGIDKVNGKLVVHYIDGSVIYEPDYSWFTILQTYSFGGSANLNGIAFGDGAYWLADMFSGLVKFSTSGATEGVSFVGPPKNEFYGLDWQNGKLAVSSGRLNGTGRTYTKGGVYTFENEEWTWSNPFEDPTWEGTNIWDFTTVSINPLNDQVATGTYSEIPISIISSNANVIDTFTPNNSPLEFTTLGNNNSFISDVQYDNSGNLWVLNGYANDPLKALTSDGQWVEYNLGSAASGRITDDIAIDYNGNKWLGITGVGMYGFKDNGTISDLSDDDYVILNSGENTGALPSNQVNAIAVDFDDEIWIGTDNGFAVLYNSASAFDASPGDYNAQRIKVEFEGNVEYVLGSTNITDIEVDGANRKWFGTANAGIILLSPDGLEILEQHTVENSPLISNTILDLEIDHKTGEMYIITDLGLVSYRTDATYQDEDYSDVIVFPNPVRPGYTGPITIQGIKYDSDVRITDAAGNLVYKTTSNGGTATWNGKRLTGEDVTTGVYYIWTAPNEGKGRKVGKVLVVK